MYSAGALNQFIRNMLEEPCQFVINTLKFVKVVGNADIKQRSVHLRICLLAFSHKTDTTFFPGHRLFFSHASEMRGEKSPEKIVCIWFA